MELDETSIGSEHWSPLITEEERVHRGIKVDNCDEQLSPSWSIVERPQTEDKHAEHKQAKHKQAEHEQEENQEHIPVILPEIKRKGKKPRHSNEKPERSNKELRRSNASLTLNESIVPVDPDCGSNGLELRLANDLLNNGSSKKKKKGACRRQQ